jgi:ABC-type polysaccharide/polyol phosphate export permease
MLFRAAGRPPVERSLVMSVSAARSKPSLFASVKAQLRLIVALLIREGQANHTTKTLGFFWQIGEPLLFT